MSSGFCSVAAPGGRGAPKSFSGRRSIEEQHPALLASTQTLPAFAAQQFNCICGDGGEHGFHRIVRSQFHSIRCQNRTCWNLGSRIVQDASVV
jgi:hypothetical protein